MKLYKPIYIGFAVLELSKSLMCEFDYQYMKPKPKYGDAIDLCYLDTDCFIYDIRTVDFYQHIQPALNDRFDTSDYEKDNPY